MNTRVLRVDYNNQWPNKFKFPIEEKFYQKLVEKNLPNAFFPAKLSYSDDHNFQFYLGYMLDALDMLPMRPDLAFDHIWKALDTEFFLIQKESTLQSLSRFDVFVNEILNDANTISFFLQYLKIIPYQTCEYAAKRIIEASCLKDSDNNAKTLFTRAENSLGKDFIEKFIEKYPPNNNSKPEPSVQRKAGRLLKLVFSGNEVELDGVKFSIAEEKLATFLLKVILANSRNERFHGAVFPPFRSSVAKMETYAHAYYLFHISYALLLDVFLYREHDVIDQATVQMALQKNVSAFEALFDGL